MSRWADDPEKAADALIESFLGSVALAGRVLLVNQSGAVMASLAARRIRAEAWNRRLIGTMAAAPWPPAGPFDLVLLRIPKSKDELEMSVHASLGVLRARGRLIVYGGNEEGIRSAAPLMKQLTGTVETVATRGHGRVLASDRPEQALGLRGGLAAWRHVAQMKIAGVEREWVSYPGVFAANRVDAGTALFIATLPTLNPNARVLDFGCGSGMIAAAAQVAQPALALAMVDNDSVALEAARENVPRARRVLATGLADAAEGAYDAILSNPPLHQGIAESRALLGRLVADARANLATGGVLQIVVQRRIPLDRLFAQHFGGAAIAAENERYRVWRATRA